ncbi:unnamed protein product [Staurois parvus]|uniref:Secreted protein n=1 Tax=Staurois parvus TaxID=386267 RepID=A0ABN9FVU5_9NEOB|nr:unnamed protein product [Staurois parvus]
MFHSRHYVFFFVLLSFATPYSFEAISYKNIYLGLITPEYRVPVVFYFSAWALKNSRWAFLCMGFRRGFLQNDTHACHSSAVYAVLCHGKQSPQFGFLFL